MSDKSAWDKIKEEQERRKKEEINGKINEKNTLIGNCQNIKNELEAEKSAIVNAINDWNEAKKTYYSEKIAEEVVIKNVFEGTAAETVKAKNKSKIQKMDSKVQKASEIIEWIDKQLNTLNDKITSLQGEIANLQKQL